MTTRIRKPLRLFAVTFLDGHTQRHESLSLSKASFAAAKACGRRPIDVTAIVEIPR